MRCAVLGAAVALAACAAAFANGSASNARELRDVLVQGARAAKLEPVRTERGCGPSGCTVDVDELSIARDSGAIRTARGAPVKLVQHKPADGRDLPEPDWDPLDAQKVYSGGRRWGTCLELAHTGIGRSGVHQRWASVVLVPSQAGVAHRFVGYWAGCDSLVEGARPAEVVLPLVEPAASGSRNVLHIVRFHCSAQGCVRRDDSRSVTGDPAGESGALTIGGK